MKKSTYSLILSDRVVEEIDKLAYSIKTSRSNLINEILANHVSYVTPEQRMRDILSMAQSFLVSDERYFFPEMQSASFLDVRAALKYKYKPTIRYCIELYNQSAGPFGELRVSLRTQSEQLLVDISHFFERWVELERKHIHEFYPDGVPFGFENNCYVRDFYVKNKEYQIANDILGKAIAEYISALDNTLKVYLNTMQDKPTMLAITSEIYLNYLENTDLII